MSTRIRTGQRQTYRMGAAGVAFMVAIGGFIGGYWSGQANASTGCNASAVVAAARTLYNTYNYDSSMRDTLGEEDSALVNLVLTERDNGQPFDAGAVRRASCAGLAMVPADGR